MLVSCLFKLSLSLSFVFKSEPKIQVSLMSLCAYFVIPLEPKILRLVYLSLK